MAPHEGGVNQTLMVVHERGEISRQPSAGEHLRGHRKNRWGQGGVHAIKDGSLGGQKDDIEHEYIGL